MVILELSYHAHIAKGAGTLEGSMDYLLEARKFIQRAREAVTLDVIKADLEMAEWFLSKAIEERDESSSQEPRGQN